MKKRLYRVGGFAALMLLIAGLAWGGYTTLVYMEGGGNKMVVASGGEIEVKSGGSMDVESGGSLKLAGTAITATAAEVNKLSGVTATTAEINKVAGVTAGTTTASKALVVGASKQLDFLQFLSGTGAANTAVLLGGGTAAAPNTTATANKNFVEFRASTTATDAGSDSRLFYLRFALDGSTTGGGETARIFTNVNAAVGTAHGAHTSLSFGASGSVSGQAIASRNTLHLKSGTATGTVAPLQAEIYLDAADSAPPAASHSLFRGIVAGDATNKASVTTALSLEGVQATAASSGVADMVTTGAADTTSNTRIKIKINGTEYWLLATSAQPAP